MPHLPLRPPAPAEHHAQTVRVRYVAAAGVAAFAVVLLAVLLTQEPRLAASNSRVSPGFLVRYNTTLPHEALRGIRPSDASPDDPTRLPPTSNQLASAHGDLSPLAKASVSSEPEIMVARRLRRPAFDSLTHLPVP